MIGLDLQGQTELERQIIPNFVRPHDHLLPIELWISIFQPQIHSKTVKIPVDIGLVWPWPLIPFLMP